MLPKRNAENVILILSVVFSDAGIEQKTYSKLRMISAIQLT